MAKTIIALYDDLSSAHRAVRDLVDSGFDRETISLMTQDRQRARSADEEDAASEAAGTGAGIGALVGGLGGLLVGLGALAIPGIGPLLVAGPLVTTLAGAGVGAGLGALVGALAGMGVPENEARYFAEGVRRGATLVSLRSPDERATEAIDIMERYGPVDVERRASEWRAGGWQPTEEYRTGAEETEVSRERWEPDYDIHGMSDYEASDEPGYEASERGMTGEPLNTGYRERGIADEWAGAEDDQSMREEMAPPYDAARRAGDVVEREDEDILYSTGTVEERHRPYREMDEPAVGPDATIRREDDEGTIYGRTAQERSEPTEGMGSAGAGAEEWGDRVGGGAGTPGAPQDDDALRRPEQDFRSYEPFYRSHFEQVFGRGPYEYDRYRAAYHFGYSLSQDPHYRGRSWSDIEDEARQEWEDQYEMFWNEVSDAVYEGWRVPTAIGSREIRR
ncbi:MAG TPA: hypothetical protein GX702_14020 [Chloroflexi bacterium]|jgi:hypothetical protein|nr:hypothetical protein [Chloroflexota bacterium]